jgi:hypothetical protein
MPSLLFYLEVIPISEAIEKLNKFLERDAAVKLRLSSEVLKRFDDVVARVNAKLDGTKLSRNEALNVLLDSTDAAFHLTMAFVEKHKKQESRITIIQK